MRRTWFLVPLALVLAAAVAGCNGDDDDPTPGPTSAAPPGPKVGLTLGVWGGKQETEAYQGVVDTYNAYSDEARVKIKSYGTHDDLMAALDSGDVPDVFLVSRGDLADLGARKINQPLGDLLDDRDVDFGDGYSRPALEAFAADRQLQCMPYGVSPMVIYYNKKLVNFTRMAKRGMDAPDPESTSWSFDQFSAAASFASRPARGTKGVHIAATLPGLSPFILSGGGSVFDDDANPTSLTFSSDDSKAALDQTLQLLRNPQVTLDEQQLEQASPLRWFERGKLGMIAGYRSLVPQLRLVPDLDFDVMAMPSLGSSSTVGDVSGLCVSRKAASVPDAADFMVHELSVDSVTRVTRTGYLAPANLEVALSDTFLQPLREPEHSTVFNSAVRNMAFAPLVDTLPALQQAVKPALEELVYGVGTLNLDAVTEQIDDTSRPILNPAFSESPGPSATPVSPAD